MSGLHDKVANGAPEGNTTWRGLHALGASLALWSEGIITRQDIIDSLGLDASDIQDLDWLKSKYDASTNKDRWLRMVRDLSYCVELGIFGMEVEANFVAAVNTLP